MGTRWRSSNEPSTPSVGWPLFLLPLSAIVLGLVLAYLGPLTGLAELLIIGGVAGLPVVAIIVISGRDESPWR